MAHREDKSFTVHARTGKVVVHNQGYLKKKSPKSFMGFNQWQSRFFVLESGADDATRLLYYKTDRARAMAETPTGSIPVTEIKSVIIPQEHKDGCRFDIETTSRRVFELQADTPSECQRWIMQLTKMCRQAGTLHDFADEAKMDMQEREEGNEAEFGEDELGLTDVEVIKLMEQFSLSVSLDLGGVNADKISPMIVLMSPYVQQQPPAASSSCSYNDVQTLLNHSIHREEIKRMIDINEHENRKEEWMNYVSLYWEITSFKQCSTLAAQLSCVQEIIQRFKSVTCLKHLWPDIETQLNSKSITFTTFDAFFPIILPLIRDQFYPLYLHVHHNPLQPCDPLTTTFKPLEPNPASLHPTQRRITGSYTSGTGVQVVYARQGSVVNGNTFKGYDEISRTETLARTGKKGLTAAEKTSSGPARPTVVAKHSLMGIDMSRVQERRHFAVMLNVNMDAGTSSHFDARIRLLNGGQYRHKKSKIEQAFRERHEAVMNTLASIKDEGTEEQEQEQQEDSEYEDEEEEDHEEGNASASDDERTSTHDSSLKTLVFHLYHNNDTGVEDLSFHTLLGRVECTLGSVLLSPNAEISLPITMVDAHSATLTGMMHIMFHERRLIKVSNCPRYCYRSYCFRDVNMCDIVCHEQLQESPLTFQLPYLSIVRAIEHTRKMRKQVMLSMSETDDELQRGSFTIEEDQRKSQFISFCKRQVKAYTAIIAKWEQLARLHYNYQGIYRGLHFKPSVEKSNRPLAFVPINLHVQSFTVTHTGRNRSNFTKIGARSGASSNPVSHSSHNSTAPHSNTHLAVPHAHAHSHQHQHAHTNPHTPANEPSPFVLEHQDHYSDPHKPAFIPSHSSHNLTRPTVCEPKVKESNLAFSTNGGANSISYVEKLLMKSAGVQHGEEEISSNLEKARIYRKLEPRSPHNHSYSTTTYLNTTVGAMSAHSMGFKQGGMMKLLHRVYELQNKHSMEVAALTQSSKSASSSSSKSSQPSGDSSAAPNNSIDPEVESGHKILDKHWLNQQRQHILLSQAMTSLTTCFVAELLTSMHQVEHWKQVASIGYLQQVESLLSCFSNEQHMLQDLCFAVRALEHVKFTIVQQIDIENPHGNWPTPAAVPTRGISLLDPLSFQSHPPPPPSTPPPPPPPIEPELQQDMQNLELASQDTSSSSVPSEESPSSSTPTPSTSSSYTTPLLPTAPSNRRESDIVTTKSIPPHLVRTSTAPTKRVKSESSGTSSSLASTATTSTTLSPESASSPSSSSPHSRSKSPRLSPRFLRDVERNSMLSSEYVPVGFPSVDARLLEFVTIKVSLLLPSTAAPIASLPLSQKTPWFNVGSGPNASQEAAGMAAAEAAARAAAQVPFTTAPVLPLPYSSNTVVIIIEFPPHLYKLLPTCLTECAASPAATPAPLPAPVAAAPPVFNPHVYAQSPPPMPLSPLADAAGFDDDENSGIGHDSTKSSPSSSPQSSSTSSTVQPPPLSIPAPSSHVADSQPAQLQSPIIHIWPVLITQGVNELQTMANKIGKTELQQEINLYGHYILESYYQHFGRYLKSTMDSSTCSVPEILSNGKLLQVIGKDLKLVKIMIQNYNNFKNIELLVLAADIVKRMKGGRMVCCKSAKDRTSMSVSWDQARVLFEHHGLSEHDLQYALNLMRTEGVRRLNVVKNTGQGGYAFNVIQRSLLPPIFRPPENACSSNIEG